MPSLGSGFGSSLGADNAVTQPTVSNDDARGLLVSLMPPGQLYDFDNPAADIYSMFYAFGQMAKMFGYDVADRLNVEFDPATCVEKIPDWELALAILPGTGNSSQSKTTAQRQAGIVSKLRESGASTIANIQSTVAPLLGYADPSQLVVMEESRAALRAAHTYADATSYTVSSGTPYTYSFVVNDDGLPLSGVQLYIVASSGTGLSITLTNPAGTSETFTPTSDITTGQYFYAATGFASSSVNGVWTVRVSKSGSGSVTITDAALFVEGLGIGGLGGGIYYWGVYADPTLVNAPDYIAALASIQRLNPAHAQGFLVQSLAPYPDTLTGAHESIPDTCVPV